MKPDNELQIAVTRYSLFVAVCGVSLCAVFWFFG